MTLDLFKLRQEYTQQELDINDLQDNPINQFSLWFDQALTAGVHEPNAMVLATVSSSGQPSARIVLLKKVDNEGFSFFTNYQSRKGLQLQENNRAAIVFYWAELERQVRIEGIVQKTTSAESDEYFAQRPTGSRIGAWASPQSNEIQDRAFLDKLYLDIEKSMSDKNVTRPEFWGGYKLKPHLLEFWQGRENRLHDRMEYRLINNEWQIRRLAP
jgi:pyridoxamine 5'-phosphate oxidase